MTTTQNAHSRRAVRGRRGLRQAVVGVGAGLVLAALVVGVPLALSVVAPIGLPQTWPVWSELVHIVMRPDDGRLALAVVRLIAWGAWAAFTWTVLLEAGAAARNTTARQVRLLGGLQRVAAALVGAVLLGLAGPSPTPSASAVVETVALQVEPRLGARVVSGEPRAAVPAQRQVEDLRGAQRQARGEGPVVEVGDGDSLWFLAERHLGDGARYPEILALNLGRIQPDGLALTDAHWIEPGWRLVLPADAVDLPGTSAAGREAASTGGGTVVVESGDSLWKLADEHLGDGARFPEIVELNEGVTQADGDALADPDLIQPGWVLTLPGEPDAGSLDASSAEPGAAVVEPDAAVVEPDGRVVPPDSPEVGPPASALKSDATLAQPDAAPAQPDAALAVPHASAASGSGDAGPAESVADQDDDGQVPSGLFLGLTAFAAAGLIGELARRRHLQHRLRRTGERITRPARGSPAEAAEREWHAAPTPLTIGQLRTALEHLGAACFTSGRDLPRVGVVEVAPDLVTLHLVTDDPAAVEPFACSASPRLWTAPTAALAALEPIGTAHAPDPYPALVSIGHTDHSTLLLNLEAPGVLRVVGDPEDTAAVIRAMVAELATSELTGRIAVSAGGEFADLADACDPGYVRALDGEPEQLLPGDLAGTARVLESYGLEDTLQARSDREAPGIWRPVVYVHQDPPPCTPWSGPVVITTAPDGDGWRLTVAAGRGRLDPLGLALATSRLTKDGFERITELLTAAIPPEADLTSTLPRPATDEASAALAAIPEPPTALTEPPAPPNAVDPERGPILRVNVLGPLRIENTPADRRVPGLQAELLVYLALNRDCTDREIDDALWPGKRTDGEARWGLAYRTRNTVDKRNLPPTPRGEDLRLAEDVTCDWDDFRRLARDGLAAGAGGVADLRAALALVRGRPLAGVPDSSYGWADPAIDEMISAIVDVAHTLSRALMEIGDARGALGAATVGLSADASSGRLRDDAVAAAKACGDLDEARRIQERYNALLAELDEEFV